MRQAMQDTTERVTVSVKLTQKQAGQLYMKSMQQSERIKQLKDALRKIIALAESEPGSGSFAIATAAKAAIETPSKETA